jgi:predicted transcriptional regulator
MNYNIPISSKLYNQAMLNVINCFLKLTNKELEIIKIVLDNNIINLDTKARVLIRENSGLSIGTLNNYIKRLKDKNVLIQKRDTLEVNNNILQPIEDKEISVSFNIV